MSTSTRPLPHALLISAIKAGIFAIALAAASAVTLGCTAAQRVDAGVDVAAANVAVQLACAAIDGADPAAAKVCAPLSSTASQVAQLVASLLKDLPVPIGAALDVTPTTFALRGAVVTLPAWQAQGVIAATKARAKK